MESKQETNYYSKAAIWIHSWSALLIFGDVFGFIFVVYLYASTNVTLDDTIVIVFLSFYAPFCLLQLYSTKKMREGDIRGGKIALYLDSIIVLLCSIDLAFASWGLSERIPEWVLMILVLNMLVVFLLAATPAGELRMSIEEENY